MAHKHSVYDTDARFSINPITRAINNESKTKITICQYDHNSQEIGFSIPLLIDGHPMTQCNQIEIHYINISADGQTQNPGTYEVNNIKADGDKAVFGWLISQEATQIVGSLNFLITFKCVEDGVTVYRWSTAIFKGLPISDGMDNGEEVIQEYPDILAQWKAEIFRASDNAVLVVAMAEENAIAAIEAKKQSVLDSIPDEYEELSVLADQNHRNKAGAIVLDAEGESIVLDDASEYPLQGLKLFGKSEQIKTTGVQLANFKDVETLSNNGLTWSCKGGVVKVSGTTTGLSSTSGVIGCNLTGKIGTFHISGNDGGVEVYVSITKADGSHIWRTQSSFDLDGTETEVIVYCQVYNTGVTVNATLYPMVCAGDTALPWESYSGGVASPSPEWAQEINSVENAAVSVFGKNLAYFGHILPKTSKGVTFSLQEDGSIIAHGTPTVSGEEVIDTIHAQSITRPTLVNGQVYESESTIQIEHNDGSMTYNRIVTITDDIKAINAYIQPRAEYYTNGQVFNVKLWLVGNEMDEFEAGKPVQAMTLPRTLPGIPVSSGGNYTDENGQQWICDEVDLARGVYVQRVVRRKILSSDNWATMTAEGRYWLIEDGFFDVSTSAFCTHFVRAESWANHTLTDGTFVVHRDPSWNDGRLSFKDVAFASLNEWKTFLDANEVFVVYELATPIETALTDAEITAFKALHSNRPNTTILNDAGAYMAVEYVADTKTYIDNKIKELMEGVTE